jgi:pimeloyl-ACP methyl ester carboxylesterase
MLEQVREGIAAYIRKNKLDHPAIVGHSLGGFLALDLAAHYPDLPGRLVIVDAYPFMGGVADAKATAEQARAMAAQIRGYMVAQTQDMYEGYVRSGMSTRMMVEKESDFQRIVGWGLASDRTAVTDAVVEMFSADLRDDIARIKSPTLVMGSYIGFQGATREGVEGNLRRQYAKLQGVEIQVTDKAHHFIMWDDPEWMFGHMDRFLKPVSGSK